VPELIEDQTAWPKMLSLKNCLCEEIEKSGLPSVCFCEVMPGSVAAFDFSDGGQAWVRLVNSYPSLVFPTQSQDLRSSCSAPIANVLEVGIVRCPPRPGPRGEMPGAAEEREATRIQMADMAAMRRAILCCFGSSEAVLGIYTPVGPGEGAIGGTWTVTV
jgi:hypothetical protein